MKVALVRIGIDTGSGGIHGPLLADGRFEYLPIPDAYDLDDRTYGKTVGRLGRPLATYFRSHGLKQKMANKAMHVDPEFATFTYGDPTSPKAGLRRLEMGDLLAFYCGLQGWDCAEPPALYLMGYFEVQWAGLANSLAQRELNELFQENSHVRHQAVLKEQRDSLVLVKGGPGSRLLENAARLSVVGQNKSGKPLQVLSPEMQLVFGTFGGKLSIQRSPTRWVDPAYSDRAAKWIRCLK